MLLLFTKLWNIVVVLLHAIMFISVFALYYCDKTCFLILCYFVKHMWIMWICWYLCVIPKDTQASKIIKWLKLCQCVMCDYFGVFIWSLQRHMHVSISKWCVPLFMWPMWVFRSLYEISEKKQASKKYEIFETLPVWNMWLFSWFYVESAKTYACSGLEMVYTHLHVINVNMWVPIRII